MEKIGFDEYLEYVSRKNTVEIGGHEIKLEPIKITHLYPSDKELGDTSTTVWSFPRRGRWATHRGDYRGNWPPQMANALIMMYTRPGDTVLDPMIGSGTTCIEAKLLGRNCIGVDINYDSVILTLHRLYWLEKALEKNLDSYRHVLEKLGISAREVLDADIEIYYGDARNLEKIMDNSIDLVATHPPYLNIIRYTKRREGDLSYTSSLKEYLSLIKEIVEEIYRVLKPDHHLGILVGDTRIRKHYVPLTHYILEILLDTGYILREEVIKIQHKMKTTREVWSRFRRRDFLLIYHEKLYILRKPVSEKEYKKYRYSSRQEYVKIEL